MEKALGNSNLIKHSSRYNQLSGRITSGKTFSKKWKRGTSMTKDGIIRNRTDIIFFSLSGKI